MSEMPNSKTPDWDVIIDELIGHGVVERKPVEKCDCGDPTHKEMVRLSARFIDCMEQAYASIIKQANKHPDVIDEFRKASATSHGWLPDKDITSIKAVIIVALVKYFGNLNEKVLSEYAFALSAVPEDYTKRLESYIKANYNGEKLDR